MNTLGKVIIISHLEKKINSTNSSGITELHSTTGMSPEEMLYGRKIRTEIPAIQVEEKGVRFKEVVKCDGEMK